MIDSRTSLKYLAILLYCIVELLTLPLAHAMRCGTHLISVGDIAVEVKQHCGEPDWIDRWFDEVVLGEDTDVEHRVSNITERWVYNLGPSQFMRFITLRNNRVEKIVSGDYGFNQSDSALNCDTKLFSLGKTSVEIQAKCGKPASELRRFETITQSVAPGTRQKTTVAVDEWAYNLGPNNFMRILTFYNGTLIKIETGSHGF